MKKIILFLIIFLNIFVYIESSPITSAAGIIIATRNYNDKKNEKEKIKEKFRTLYKNEKEYDELELILSTKEKEILIQNYDEKEKLWNDFLKKYDKKINEMKYNKITFRYFALMEILSSIIGVFIIIFFLKKRK